MAAQISVPFHGNCLLLVNHQNQPFTPMKPIVEGMGLDWKTQFRKLVSNTRWGVVKMTIPLLDPNNEAICLPLRKLFGWLSTISPNKVKPELKERITWYQNECDDVLWEYWNAQLQPNHIPTTLTPSQQRHIQTRVAFLANQPGNSYASVWRSVKDRFSVGTYKDIPASRFPELCKYLGATLPTLEGELVEDYPTITHQIGVNYPAKGDKFFYEFRDMNDCGWRTQMTEFLHILQQHQGRTLQLSIDDVSGLYKEFTSLQHMTEIFMRRLDRVRDAALFAADQAHININR